MKLRSLAANDRRRFDIRISDRGMELILHSTPRHIGYLNWLASDLTSTEHDQLKALLNKQHSSMVNHGDLPEIHSLTVNY